MSSISPANSTALLILQQPRPLARPADDALANSNGISSVIAAGAGSPLAQAQAKISEAMFSVNSIDATAMKVRLIERLGEQFDIKQSDYKSSASYGQAIKRAVEELKAKPDSAQAIMTIEKNLGLDKLGISLDELVNATIDPNGEDSKKLDAALTKQLGEVTKAAGMAGSLRPDAIGIYGR